jgi:hypothetical protein
MQASAKRRHLTAAGARVFALALGVAAAAAGCGKGAAREALESASAALESSKPDISTYVPDQLEPISQDLARARADFDKGDYEGARSAASSLLPKVQAAREAAVRKKDELVAAFKELEGTLPSSAAALEARLVRLSRMTTPLPSDLDQATVEAGKSNLETVTETWEKASKSFASGDVVAAVKLGAEARTGLEELTRVFVPRPASRTAP